MAIRGSSFVALGLALIGPTLGAQQSPATPATSLDDLVRQVELQLSSDDARTIAWGAYTAGAYHLMKAVPRLQRILESPPVSAGERRAFLDVVLDSLIQLDARLPASLLVRYVDERPVQTVALLAKATDRDQILLDLLPKTSEFQWYAIADMLFDLKTRPALAAHLLRTLHLHMTLTVSDTDPVRPGRGGASGVMIGDGMGEDPKGYPPHAEYRFELGPRSGLVVIADGPHPVYYSRRVAASFQYAVSEVQTGGPTDGDRLAYLHAMRGSANPPVFAAETITSIRWTTEAAFMKRVDELRADIQRAYRALVDELNRWYALPSDVLKLPASIDVRLIDERNDRSTPLPVVR